MRDPDLVFIDKSAGEDNVIVDAHFGGAFKPFRMIVRSDRARIEEACENIMREKAKEFGLIDEDEAWRKSLIGGMLQECLRNIGKTVDFPSFWYGSSCSMRAIDRSV